MDQLKLILEYKFWILAGLAMLLPPIGWYAATDNIKKETTDRDNKIKAAEKRVPNPKEVPNEKWIQGAQEIDRELTVSVTQSYEHLYEHQKIAMTEPPMVEKALAQCKVTYLKDGGMTPDFLEAKQIFALQYLNDWKTAVEVVKPYKALTGEGLVVLPEESGQQETPITRHLEVEQWKQTLGFTGAQLWEAQQDVWFVRSLMKAIAQVNQGTTEIGNSRIKKIIEATLRGGDTRDLIARKSGKQNGPAGPAGSTSGQRLGGSMRANFGLGGGAGGAAFESTYKPPKAFDPNDVFGDDGSTANAAYDTHGKRSDAGAAADVKPWVASDQKWRKRGFVLKLVMDEREIPTLLGALSESAFPVEIWHVEHQVHARGAGGERVAATQAPTANADGSDLTREQQAQLHKIGDSLRMAFNMNYLADVTVAGTLTIYIPPAAAKPAATSGTAKPALSSAAPLKPAATKPDGVNPAAVKPAPVKPAAVKPAAAQPKPIAAPAVTGARATGAQPTGARPTGLQAGSQPARPGFPASPPANTNKTNPAGNGSRPAGN